MFKPVIFREYDLRGVYKEDFDEDFARRLGEAFTVFIRRRNKKPNLTICIGYDARISSPSLAKALTEGFVNSGVKVINLGLVTTPLCYFSTFNLDGVDGAIQVTGSHNPPSHNGFKISSGKSTIFGKDILELKDIVESSEKIAGQGSEEFFDLKPMYFAKAKKEFSGLKPIKFVLDCGNGAGGAVARGLMTAAGLNPTILFEQPDGTFPNHHPDPTVEKNLVDLKNQVLKEGAVCGIGFDGDADRIGVVDHTGRMVFGDELMTVFARSILKKNPGAAIVGDVKCSDRLYDDIRKNGGRAIMWKTGHSLVKEKIKIEKAPFGGEMSGHIFFADRNDGYDDAVYAALRLVEILSETGKTIPELLSGIPAAFSTPEIRIDTTEEKKLLAVEKMRTVFTEGSSEFKVNLLDGIRISFADGWALCRSSNTQPVVVFRFESTTEAGLNKIRDRVFSVVEDILGKDSLHSESFH